LDENCGSEERIHDLFELKEDVMREREKFMEEWMCRAEFEEFFEAMKKKRVERERHPGPMSFLLSTFDVHMSCKPYHRLDSLKGRVMLR
jgi:hypothetical protein